VLELVQIKLYEPVFLLPPQYFFSKVKGDPREGIRPVFSLGSSLARALPHQSTAERILALCGRRSYTFSDPSFSPFSGA